jgi:predicted choloylglycine hydrolase
MNSSHLKTSLLLLALLLTACRQNPSQIQETAGEAETATAPQARTMREITLSGTGYELGLQHGKLLKVEIAEIVSRWKANTREELGRDPDSVLSEFFEYARFDETIKAYTPELYEEVRGIADGSGQAFREVFVLNLLDEFWVYIDDLENHHCSNVGVPAQGGRPGYIAQNMDIETYTDGYQTLMRLEGTPELPEQLILTHPGLIALNGVNASGVGVVVNTLMQLRASPEGLPVAFIIRKILGTTDEDQLLKFVQEVPHASGQNYILGVRGKVYNFEASAARVVRFDPQNANGTVYHTNHPIVNTDLKPWHAIYNPANTPEILPVGSNSYLRFAAVEKRIAANADITDATLMETLRSKDDPDNPVCRSPVGGGFTFASVIITLGTPPTLQVTPGPPDEAAYAAFGFETLPQ